MRKNHSQIIQSWVAKQNDAVSGRRIDGNGTVIRFWTDGITIYSYQMPIAEFCNGGKDRTRIRMVERERCPSNTTRAHWDAIHYVCTTRYVVGITYVQSLVKKVA